MSISAVTKTLAFDRHTMWVELEDGHSLGVSLAWFPRLLRATLEQRANHQIGHPNNDLHWGNLDESIFGEISTEGVVGSRTYQTDIGFCMGSIQI